MRFGCLQRRFGSHLAVLRPVGEARSSITRLQSLHVNLIEVQSADQHARYVHASRASHVGYRIIANHPNHSRVSSRLDRKPEGARVGLLMTMRNRGQDSTYVLIQAEARHQLWKLRHVVAHDDVSPAFRRRQAKSLNAVGIHLPTGRIEKAAPEPRSQDRRRHSCDADPRHGVGDQSKDRLPPPARITDGVVHHLPVMPREPALQKLEDNMGHLSSRRTAGSGRITVIGQTGEHHGARVCPVTDLTVKSRGPAGGAQPAGGCSAAQCRAMSTRRQIQVRSRAPM